MTNELYESMATHPDTGPVMQLLDLVEPVDEFSRALVLVRDCFSPDATLRGLTRAKLRGMLNARVMLVQAYQQAVVELVPGARTFDAAMMRAPKEQLDKLRADFEAQMAELMARPLPT